MLILYPELGIDERVKMLQNQCTKKETRKYSHSLQQSEIDEQTRQYAQDGMQLHNIKEELKNIKAEYAAKIENIESRMEERLEKIKYGKTEISGTLYGIANHVDKRMMFYDQFGELVESRDLLPDEMQGKFAFIGAPVNDAVKDLPLETLQVVNTINQEHEANTVNAEHEEVSEKEQKLDTLMAEWEKKVEGMKDEELAHEYGSTNIPQIREKVRAQFIADIQSDNAAKNRKEKPITPAQKNYILLKREGKEPEGVKKTVLLSIIQACKAKGLLDADGNLTNAGRTIDLS